MLGTDTIIKWKAKSHPADFILRICRRLWPNAIVQPADSMGLYSLQSPMTWLYETPQREFFVYRNREAANAWRERGGEEPLRRDMMHFLIDGNEITVVHDGGLVALALIEALESADRGRKE